MYYFFCLSLLLFFITEWLNIRPCILVSSRGHADTPLLPPSLCNQLDLTFFFKQLSTSKAASSVVALESNALKQDGQQSVDCTKKSEWSKRRDWGSSLCFLHLLCIVLSFLTRKQKQKKKLIYRHQQYRHLGNEKHCDLLVVENCWFIKVLSWCQIFVLSLNT